MKLISSVLKWILPVCLAGGAFVSGQVIYQLNGTGSDGSTISGTATVTPATMPTTVPTASPAVTQPSAPASLQNPVPPTPTSVVNGQAAITVTNKSGVTIYPLDGVFVTSTHAGSLTPLQLFLASINPSGGIFWDFGDPGSEGDQMFGFNAAHSYSTPGIKTITLTAIPPNITLQNGVLTFSNGPSYVATATVTVANDNRPVVQVQPGQNIPAMSNGTVYQLNAVASGTAWNGPVSIAGLQNVLIRTNGNPATIYLASPNTQQAYIGTDATYAGVTVDGLTFNRNTTGLAAGTDTWIVEPQGNGDLTLLNDVFESYGEGIYGQLAGVQNVFAENCTAPNPATNYPIWWVGQDLVVLNCSFNGSLNQWNVRTAPDPAVLTDVNISNSTISTAAENPGKGAVRFMCGQFMTLYGDTLAGVAGPSFQSDCGDVNKPISQFVCVRSNWMAAGITLNPQGGPESDVGLVNNAITGVQNSGQAIEAYSTTGGTLSNVYIVNNTATVANGVNAADFLNMPTPIPTGIYVANNWFDAPGDTWSFITDSGANTSNISAWSNNLEPVGGYAFINGANVTASQWEQETLGGGQTPAGDVYQDVPLGLSYSTTLNGRTFGSNLPVMNAANGTKGN